MSTKSRIDRLYRQLVATQEENCDACGYPENVRNVVIMSDKENLGECTGCGRRTDRKGRPLSDHAKVVVLHGGDVPVHFE